MFDLSFYRGKKVFVTGHTGFKGTWLCKMLINAGAEVTGYSRGTKKEYSLFDMSQIGKNVNSVYGDIRDYEKLLETIMQAQPEIVFQLEIHIMILLELILLMLWEQSIYLKLLDIVQV